MGKSFSTAICKITLFQAFHFNSPTLHTLTLSLMKKKHCSEPFYRNLKPFSQYVIRSLSSIRKGTIIYDGLHFKLCMKKGFKLLLLYLTCLPIFRAACVYPTSNNSIDSVLFKGKTVFYARYRITFLLVF